MDGKRNAIDDIKTSFQNDLFAEKFKILLLLFVEVRHPMIFHTYIFIYNVIKQLVNQIGNYTSFNPNHSTAALHFDSVTCIAMKKHKSPVHRVRHQQYAHRD